MPFVFCMLSEGLRPHAAGPLGLEIRLRSGEVASCIGELRLPSGEVALCIGDRGLPETSGGAPRRLRRFKNRSPEAPGLKNRSPERLRRLKNHSPEAPGRLWRLKNRSLEVRGVKKSLPEASGGPQKGQKWFKMQHFQWFWGLPWGGPGPPRGGQGRAPRGKRAAFWGPGGDYRGGYLASEPRNSGDQTLVT